MYSIQRDNGSLSLSDMVKRDAPLVPKDMRMCVISMRTAVMKSPKASSLFTHLTC